MKYTAKTNRYDFYETITSTDESGEEVQNIYIHTWTKGKQYDVTVDRGNYTVQFESDITTSQVMSVINAPQELLLNTFGVDISALVDEAVRKQNE